MGEVETHYDANFQRPLEFLTQSVNKLMRHSKAFSAQEGGEFHENWHLIKKRTSGFTASFLLPAPQPALRKTLFFSNHGRLWQKIINEPNLLLCCSTVETRAIKIEKRVEQSISSMISCVDKPIIIGIILC